MSYQRKGQDKRKLRKLYSETHTHYGAGAYYNERKQRHIRYSCHNKWARTHCRRITRKRLKNMDGSYPKGHYKKVCDYWWEIL